LITKTEAGRMSKTAEMDVSYFFEYISRVVEERAANTGDWKDPQRNPILDITDRHDITA